MTWRSGHSAALSAMLNYKTQVNISTSEINYYAFKSLTVGNFYTLVPLIWYKYLNSLQNKQLQNMAQTLLIKQQELGGVNPEVSTATALESDQWRGNSLVEETLQAADPLADATNLRKQL